ncbi:MAG: 3'-5' exonuclease [Coraliomargaritaceae bacterium]
MNQIIHIIDFEGSTNTGVLEWGMVSIQGERILEAKTRLCGTEKSIDTIESQQHGITSELVVECPAFEKDFDLFAKLRKSGPLCAHNASVEDRFLKNTWSYTRQVPDFSNPEENKLLTSWGPWLDTLPIYRRLYPDLDNYQLNTLIHLFSLEETLNALARIYCPKERVRYHCALYDALASALLLQRLFTLKELNNLSLFQLFTLSASSASVYNQRRQQELF